VRLLRHASSGWVELFAAAPRGAAQSRKRLPRERGPEGSQTSGSHRLVDRKTRLVVKSWGAPPKNHTMRIGKGATRRLTIYAFDP